MMRSHDISTPPIPGGMRSVFVLRPNRCGSTWSLPPRSRASSLAVSNARLTGAQTEDGSVAELRHRAGLFDRMWRAQVGRLADGSTMDRAPERLANRLSFGGAGTRCEYPAAATPVPTVRMSKSSQLPSTIAAARATIERGANMQEDRDRWLPLEHRWAARDFPRKAR